MEKMINKKPTILIVDDNPDDIAILTDMLANEGYKIQSAMDGLKAIESTALNPPDIILMDIQMPRIDGYEACRKIKENPAHEHLPILFISGMNISFNKNLAFAAGGVDYIQKPLQLEEVKARVKTHLTLSEYQKGLKENNLKLLTMFKSTFEQIVVGMFHAPPRAEKFIKVNKRFLSIFGYTKPEILKMNLFDLIHENFKKVFKKNIKYIIKEKIDSYCCEFQGKNKQNTELWIKASITLIRNTSGEPDFLVGTLEDVTRKKENERLIINKSKKLEQSLNEKEILLKELYHRTKNNMQVMAAMIRLKSMTFQEKKIQEAFSDIENKIYSMALVHKLLYASKKLSHINLKDYIKELIILMNPISNIGNNDIKFKESIQNIEVIIDIAIPIGLIINELITNSIKHAFPGHKKNQITLTIDKNDNELCIKYKDNGVGIAENFDWNNIESLGLLTVKSLVQEQLKGSIKMNSSPDGVSYQIRCKLNIYMPRV